MNSSEHQSPINVQNVSSLLDYALKSTYKARDADSETENIMKTCISLFGKDYKYSLVDNSNGELCSHYPSQLVILEYIKSEDALQDNVQSVYDDSQLRNIVVGARSARCRQRFATPVILYEGKHICRGATISGGAEMYGRRVIDMLSGAENQTVSAASADNCTTSDGDLQMHDRVRGQDIRLLRFFNISYIFDLMLEMKKVKFGMKVTSSEKVDKENRYSDFLLSSIPYPGCEFFRDWKDNGYRAEGLVFDWNQGFVDSYLELPSRPSPPQHIDWYSYHRWDLVTLTQNYLKLLLHYLREGDGGILVHCISGWDRTPLFVSLLRLSLWAEGVIHQSLSALEILYLTVAYDWFLFGHNLPDRVSRGEEVFFFCFTFLKHITGDEFNITQNSRLKSKRTASRVDSECLVEGALFDYDSRADGCRGSTSSISSVSSFNSTRSGADSQPLYFHVGSTDDELVHLNSMQSSIATLKVSPANRRSPCVEHSTSHRTSPSSSAVATASANASSPMPVPPRSSVIHRLSNDLRVASMASCGSWQMVSGPAVPSSASSSKSSSTSDQTDLSRRQSSSASSRECRESLRRQRLDEVRRTFVRLYRSLVDNRSGRGASASSPDVAAAASGVLTGLFENFAEKVGFRSVRSGFV